MIRAHAPDVVDIQMDRTFGDAGDPIQATVSLYDDRGNPYLEEARVDLTAT